MALCKTLVAPEHILTKPVGDFLDLCYFNRPDYKRTGAGPGSLDQVNFTSLRDACNIWRIYNDIQDSWWHVLDIAQFWGEQQAVMAPAAGPGGFNDPDALIIGQNNLGVTGMKLQMSLWVTLAGPFALAAAVILYAQLVTDLRTCLSACLPTYRISSHQLCCGLRADHQLRC